MFQSIWDFKTRYVVAIKYISISKETIKLFNEGYKFSSYEIELQNRVIQITSHLKLLNKILNSILSY